MFLFDIGYTLYIVAIGAAILGAVSGAVGTLAVLKKQSLLGDVVSHASLPGIVIAFIIIGGRSHSIFLLGAALVGFFAAAQMFYIVHRGGLKQDSSLSLILSVYFGFGLVLLSYTQHKPGMAQAGIEKFLFGEAATMLTNDVKAIAVIGVIVLFVLLLFWKDFFMIAFDSNYATAIGFPVVKFEILFIALLVATVVMGLQTVGVVLMSALLIAPAAAARQWSNNIKTITLLAMFFGMISGVIGSVISSLYSGLPTGPCIILIASLITILSMLFAPKRGLLGKKEINKKNSGYLLQENILLALYEIAIASEDMQTTKRNGIYPFKIFPMKDSLPEQLTSLIGRGLITERVKDYYIITDNGIAYVEEHYPNKWQLETDLEQKADNKKESEEGL